MAQDLSTLDDPVTTRPGADPREEASGVMSRRRFLTLGAAAGVALLGGTGCGRARRIVRGQRERTGGGGENRGGGRGHRGFGLGRLLRRIF